MPIHQIDLILENNIIIFIFFSYAFIPFYSPYSPSIPLSYPYSIT